MNQDELRGVLRAAAGAFDVLGELGRDEQNSLLCLAREMTTGELVAVQVDPITTASPDTSPSLLVHRVLDPSVRAKVIGGVVRPEQYEPLGAMRRPTGESVTFARERASGEIITLSPPRSEPTPPSPTFQPPPPTPPQGFPSAAIETAAAAREGERICPSCRTEYGPEVRFCPRDGTILTTASPQQGFVGEIIADRYRVVRHIGEGGFGQVFLAEHIKMGRPCALKIMNTALRHDPEAIGRFYREASNTSRIHHPNVAVIYDFGETPEGIAYLVMEYVEGDSLGATLKYDGAMPAERAINVGAQIADALGAAHALGIVHRDLKPDNILISQRREHGDWVKVVDFGIAKATQGDWQNITRTGFVVGTLEYMSPEQITGDPVDGRSDLYSLGCVLFEMLVGEQAFTGPSGQVVLTRRLTEEPPRPRDRNPDVPPGLDAVVHRLLARSPDERYSTAEELRAALLESLSAPPVPVPTEESAAPMAQAAAATEPSASTAATAPATAPSATSRRALWLTGGLVVAALTALVLFRVSGTPSPGTTSAIPNDFIEATEEVDEPVPPDLEEGGPQVTPEPQPAAVAEPAATAEATPAAPAELRLQGLPAGASVTVDGRAVSGSPLSLAPGDRRIRVTASGYAPFETTLALREGERHSLSVEMRSTTPPGAAEPPAAAAPAQPAPGTTAPTPEYSPAPPAEAARPANATAEIRQVLGRYAQALESRDMDRIRAVYPGITSNEQNTWQAFFRNVRDLQVRLGNVPTPTVDGTRATAPFSLELEFADRGGTRRVTQNYQSMLVRSPAGAWRIDSIRAQ